MDDSQPLATESQDTQGEALGVEEALTKLNLQEETSSVPQEKQEAAPDVTSQLSDKANATEVANSDKEEPQSAHDDAATVDEATTATSETQDATGDEYIVDPASLTDPLPALDIDNDLLAALRSLQVEDDTGSSEKDEPFDLLPLVLDDLEVDPEEQDFFNLQDYSDVFDDVEDSDTPQDNGNSLQENLDKLSLSEGREERNSTSQEPEFPWHMLCRPCQVEDEDPISKFQHLYRTDPEAALASVDLAREIAEAQNGPPLSDDELLQLSLLAMAENDHVLDDGAYEEHNEDGQVYEDSFQSYIVSRRPEAVEAAMTYTRAFGTGLYQPAVENVNPINERSGFGHKETVYGIHFSECGKYLATASQDATVRIWDVATNALLSTLTGHNKDYECLRTVWAPPGWSRTTREMSKNFALIASGGADGIVKIWLSPDPSKKDSWECVYTLDHSSFEARVKPSTSENAEDTAPQIYALQFIDHWQGLASQSTTEHGKNSFLMTSSDDYIHLWEMEETKEKGSSFAEVFSIRFTSVESFGSGVSVCRVTSAGLDVPQDKPSAVASSQVSATSEGAYGGERNPENVIYIFDASYCQENGLLGVALSDGSVRLVNGRGVCVSVLSLPGCKSHLTAFAWDSTGSRLASCVATGHLILWSVDDSEGKGKAMVNCVAVMEGGHQPGRPVFGAKFCGVDDEDLIVTWGVDGRLCLWDSQSHGQIHAPISTLVSRQGYPIYGVDITSATGDVSILARLAVSGGRDAGFVGVPIYLYDVARPAAEQDAASDMKAKASSETGE